MTNIEAVRAWLRTYPPLQEGRLNVDFLPEEAQNYAVEMIPCEPEVKRYFDGSSIRRFAFLLASCEFSGDDIQQNTDNLGFYEAFAAWVERQNQQRQLPLLAQGRTARRVKVTTNGYQYDADAHGSARYQIQMQMTYFQEGGR